VKPRNNSNSLLLFFCLAFSLSSCELINPEEELPAYLYIQEFNLQTNESAEGSDSEKITEAWLSVDGRFLGAYPLPARVPVLAAGEQEISLQAGIRDNGISSTPEVYPFYRTFRQNVALSPLTTDTLRPQTGYTDNTTFAFIEDFEQGAPIFQDIRIGTTDNEMRTVEDVVFEGQASGRIRLDAMSPAAELATTTRFRNLTANSPFVYLELNYRSEVPVVWGLIGFRDGVPGTGTPLFDPGFRASEEWNKIYFNLSPLLATGNFDAYQIALQAVLPQEDGEFTQPEAFVWLDNIKLVHF
jgi:hypothetical protein